MKKILFVLLAMPLLLTGCSEPEGIATSETYVQDTSPSLLRTGDIAWHDGYCYLVDKNTGVVYLEYSVGYHHAITLMVNADGTPITAEQLGIKY